MTRRRIAQDSEDGETEVINPYNPPNASYEICPTSPLHTVLDDEMERLKHSLMQIDQAWNQVTHPDEVCKLVMTQLTVLRERRKFMMLPLGDGSRQKNKTDAFYDD